MRQQGSTLLRVWRYLFNFYGAAALLFLIVPVLVIVPLSFNASSFLSYPLSGFSLRWYDAFFHSNEWLGALMNSLLVAPLATLLATVLGVLAAMGLVRGDFRGKALVMAVIISPMVAPVVIIAVGMFFFFAKLSLLNSYLGLVLAHALLGVPFVVITVVAVLKSYDTNLTRAAVSLGASPLLAFCKVTLPLIAPGVFSGALFAFATSFDEVVVTLFLASPTQRTLPIQMFAGIRENLDPTIAAAATIMIAASLLLLIVMEVLRRRGEKMRQAQPV
ncbi:ABC transporter permease [Pantoea stewartii]|uniref:ABC transporter permease n=1 Tax=Pantoea stewartii TaxID=66269 RepID=UPI0021D48769|nr:ABC transporter permease [Pantoea stewartii]MCU7366098.1 ABC transporter permease [Pantoea stewartii]